jgi:hypothetical protein
MYGGRLKDDVLTIDQLRGQYIVLVNQPLTWELIRDIHAILRPQVDVYGGFTSRRGKEDWESLTNVLRQFEAGQLEGPNLADVETWKEDLKNVIRRLVWYQQHKQDLGDTNRRDGDPEYDPMAPEHEMEVSSSPGFSNAPLAQRMNAEPMAPGQPLSQRDAFDQAWASALGFAPRSGGVKRKSQTAKFCRCIKQVRKTIRPRKGSTKESAAIGVCVKSVLHSKRRTVKTFKCGKSARLVTQKRR